MRITTPSEHQASSTLLPRPPMPDMGDVEQIETEWSSLSSPALAGEVPTQSAEGVFSPALDPLVGRASSPSLPLLHAPSPPPRIGGVFTPLPRACGGGADAVGGGGLPTHPTPNNPKSTGVHHGATLPLTH